jgi:dienelactone hydrolase
MKQVASENLQAKPAAFPGDTVYPAPLDFGETPAAWRERRASLRDAWARVLGPFPAAGDLFVQVLEEQDGDGYCRQRIRYQTEALDGGVWTEAFRLLPLGRAGRRPAVIVFHPTTHDIYEPVGLAGPPSRHNAVELVRRGYVVLCPRNFLWEYRGPYCDFTQYEGIDADNPIHTVTRRFLDDHPGATGLGKMVWDGIRAVDCLTSMAEVDPARIGCFGFSLGAKEALYVAAFDERIASAVSIDGGISLRYSNWNAPWYLGSRMRELGGDRDHHQVLALIAPRSFLLVGSTGGIAEDDGKYCDGADGERSWPFIEAVLPLYRMLRVPDRIGILCHAYGHSLPAVARETAYAWLDRDLDPQRGLT